ncbi:MAG TPA: aldo/keto reductase [Verrucomicrobiae bacterium]
MKLPQIRFSSDGLPASRIAWGAWRLADSRLSTEQIRALVHAAVDAGFSTIDHADIYGGHTCQRLFGDAVGGDSSLREKIQIITKCGIKLMPETGGAQRVKYYDTSREYIVASVEDSLRALRTDRVEVLLIHRPDPMLDPDEIAKAFAGLKESGKVLHFGVSNFTTAQFDLLASRLPFGLVTNQLQFSVLHTAPLYDGTFDQCLRLAVSPMAWSPLDGGRLIAAEDQRTQRVRRALAEIGRELNGATVEQVALAWILAHPARIIPVVGTCNKERVQSSADAAELKLTREQWFFILQASTGAPVP